MKSEKLCQKLECTSNHGGTTFEVHQGNVLWFCSRMCKHNWRLSLGMPSFYNGRSERASV